jgi:hypothetical protein
MAGNFTLEKGFQFIGVPFCFKSLFMNSNVNTLTFYKGVFLASFKEINLRFIYCNGPVNHFKN